MATGPKLTTSGNTVTVSAAQQSDPDSTEAFQETRNALDRQRLDAKEAWPELVGVDAKEAQQMLEQTTGKNVYLVAQGSMVTMDYRANRIRITYSPETGKVTRTPRVG